MHSICCQFFGSWQLHISKENRLAKLLPYRARFFSRRKTVSIRIFGDEVKEYLSFPSFIAVVVCCEKKIRKTENDHKLNVKNDDSFNFPAFLCEDYGLICVTFWIFFNL